MQERALQFINQQFDFEYDDQPDEMSGYEDRIIYMWKRAREMGIDSDLENCLSSLVKEEDPVAHMNSYFLPGKHDVKSILIYALSLRNNQ